MNLIERLRKAAEQFQVIDESPEYLFHEAAERIAELEEQIENVREIHGRKVVELMHENRELDRRKNRELDRRIAEMKADITEWEQENTVIINKLDALLERLEEAINPDISGNALEAVGRIRDLLEEARDD